MPTLFCPEVVLPLLTSTFKSNLASSIHLYVGLLPPPPGLPYSYFIIALSSSIFTKCPSHSNLCTVITVMISKRFKFIVNFLIHFYSPATIFACWPIYFSQDFPFPRLLSLFPFYLLGSTIWHHTSQLIMLFYRNPLLMNVLRTFSLIYDLVHCKTNYQGA